MDLDEHCEQIRESFFSLHLNVEFILHEKDVEEVVSLKALNKIRKAMRRPVMLPTELESVLEMYEDYFGMIFAHVQPMES
jgi:hypothetical protein